MRCLRLSSRQNSLPPKSPVGHCLAHSQAQAALHFLPAKPVSFASLPPSPPPLPPTELLPSSLPQNVKSFPPSEFQRQDTARSPTDLQIIKVYLVYLKERSYLHYVLPQAPPDLAPRRPLL